MEPDQYRVVWTLTAKWKLEEIVTQILIAAPTRAIPFGRRLEQAVATLSHSPLRCSRTPENSFYRQLIVKRYRIIFHVTLEEVIIDTIIYPYQVFHPEKLGE